MKKLIVLTLAVGVLIVGLAQPANVKPLGLYVFQSLEQVELEGKVLGFGFFGGRMVLKVEDSYVLFPMRFLNLENVVIEFGETIKVVGRKVDIDGKVLILPEKLYYADREFDIDRYVSRFMNARRGFMGRRRLYGFGLQAPRVPFMRFRGVPGRAPMMPGSGM